MFHSEHFGRIFWVDDNNDFRSCPQNVNGTGDFTCKDYVSEWEDWEGVNYELLFSIHQSCVINKNNYANSLTTKGV
tara:strand:- start:1579 stop:1806 length:228 start_codon:yes stop_codon:yes gene_type:complete